MYSKIIFFIATLYIVNATVITHQDYGDDVKSLVNPEDSPVAPACNNQECTQRCQKLKFPGGICVNSRCKCYNYRTSEDFGALIEEYILRRCDPERCNKKCQNKKLPGGKCIKRRCKCDKPERVAGSFTSGDIDHVQDVEFDIPLEALQDAEFDNAETFSDPLDFTERRRCSQRVCNFKCVRKGLGAGTCADGKCKCSKNAVEREFIAEDPEGNGVEEMDVDQIGEAEMDIADQLSGGLRCFSRICNLKCRWRGFDSGTCVNGKCKCAIKESTTPPPSSG